MNTSFKRSLVTLGLLGLLAPVARAQQSFPDVPLQTSANSPAANIMFILDDSGSMEWDYMPDGLNSSEFYRKNYSLNPLAYNPNKTYAPWKNHDQSDMTGGMNYTSVFGDASRLTGNTNLRNSTQVFYKLINENNFGSTSSSNYYRYTLTYEGSGWWGYNMVITRCEYRNADQGFNRNCVTGNSALPSSRSLEDELTNYATWYSYHRTRVKVAKAGVTEAFSQLNANVRLGYDSIWNRSPLNIPVGTDGGLFRGNNKSTWFNRIINADATGGTPLHGALVRAGKYFEQTGSSGPWGPESGRNQYSCRQNFTILTTDGYWNNNNGFSDNSQLVGNADGTAGTEITSTKGERYTYQPSRPFRDNFSDTLADVAMYYWKRDLRPDLENNVSASTQDPAFWQHMTTFGISIGLQGTLDPANDFQSIQNGSKQWLNPWKRLNQGGSESWSNESAIRIDDLWHASVNGRGTFNVATDPEQFSKSIKNALNAIQKKLASGSNVSTSSTSLQTDTRIFHANYYSGTWTGEVAAYDISSQGVAQDPSWIASENIPTHGARKMFTTSNTGTASTFPTNQQKDEMFAGLGLLAPLTGITKDQVANYVKGDQSREEINGGKFRNRISLFGDVVNSSPTYSPDTDSLYIGVNDGMMHALNAMTGQELFTYTPRGINFEHLGLTSHPDYLHKYFVDGQQVVSTKKQTPNKNYLIGTLGRGGKGLYALDVTNPSTFGASNVLWDKTGGSIDNDMGHVIGEPIITKGNDGSNIVLVSNGLDSVNGSATLFVYKLETGAVLAKIKTSASGNNALAPPRGWDADGDGTVDYVYAGDLHGNLWKFDLKGGAPASWKVDLSGQPLFRARDSSGKAQPITGGLALAMEPFGNRMWVLFGTGRYISAGDIVNTDTQTVYGIIDTGSTVVRNDLQNRNIQIVENSGDTTLKLRAFETHSPLPSGKRGWLIDLDEPYSGERMIERGFITSRVFVFPTVVPVSGNPCESSGKGFLNALDAFTGTTVGNQGVNFEYFDVGNDGNTNNDSIGSGNNRIPVGSIETNIGMVTKPLLVGDQIVYGGSDGGKTSTRVRLLPASAKRLSWREVK